MSDACPCGRKPCADPTPLCVLCAVFARRPQHVDEPQCCGDCRVRLAAVPTDIADAYPLLAEIREPRRGVPDVGGRSAEAPIPLAVDPYDLTADHTVPQGPLRRGRLAANLDLQIGQLPVAAQLQAWVRDWCDLRDLGETYDGATVYAMCQWLSVRTSWACDHHPAVDEYATEMVDLRGTLLAMVGRVEQVDRPRPIPDVPCPRCRHRTLVRRSDEWTECGWPDCTSVFSPEDYDRAMRALATGVRRGQIEVSAA